MWTPNVGAVSKANMRFLADLVSQVRNEEEKRFARRRNESY